MKKWGRFNLGEDKPIEIYEGDCVMLEKGYVKILMGGPKLFDQDAEQVVAVIHLEKGQSLREIERTNDAV
jgi:hypothetical protein